MRSIHLHKWHLCGWRERIPGGTRQNDGLETGIMGATAARSAWHKWGLPGGGSAYAQVYSGLVPLLFGKPAVCTWERAGVGVRIDMHNFIY